MSAIGRNDLCPCGSGIKFKRCHGIAAGEPVTPAPAAAGIAPQAAPALLAQGGIWQRAGRLADAERAYRAVLQAIPDHPIALERLGVLASQTGHVDAALALLQRAVQRNPSSATAQFNLGGALLGAEQFEAAARCFERALALEPDLAQAYLNLGNIHKYFGRIESGIACYRRAMELRPDDAALHSNLLTALHYDDALSSDDIFAEHVRWAQRHASRHYPGERRFANALDPERPLRVGLVSSGFSSLIVGHFLRGVLSAIDQLRYPIHCYSSTPASDAMSDALRDHAFAWRDVTRLDDDAALVLVRAPAAWGDPAPQPAQATAP